MSENETLELQYLLDLARDKSTEARSRLVRILGDLFFETGSVLSMQERTLMNDILRQLIHDVEVTVRRSLADRLAVQSEAPRDLMKTLANDEIEVAYPVLIRSSVLQDIDLVEVVHHRTAEHQLAIALREGVSETVSDALVEAGNDNVIVALLENSTSQISATTMEYLVQASQRVDAFQNPLVNREELSEDLARRMYWWVSAALRDQIIDQFQIDPDTLDDVIEDTVNELLDGHRDDSAATNKSAQLVQQLRQQQALTPRFLVQTLRQGEVELFERAFAELATLDVRLIRRIIFEPGGEALAVVCKAAGMEKADFASIFLRTRSARPGDKVVDPRELPRAMSFFDRVNFDVAQRMLKRLQRDPDFLFALRQVGPTPRTADSEEPAKVAAK